MISRTQIFEMIRVFQFEKNLSDDGKRYEVHVFVTFFKMR